MDFRKVRLFLELRQIDVSNATGIAVQRLSFVERGLVCLEPSEEICLQRFLEARLDSELQPTERNAGHTYTHDKLSLGRHQRFGRVKGEGSNGKKAKDTIPSFA